jgi:hypothetical protein
MLQQIVSLVGAALILAAYTLLQLGKLQQRGRPFNALNFVGSSLLTWVAVEQGQLGFIVLEGAWALLSLPRTLRPGE